MTGNKKQETKSYFVGDVKYYNGAWHASVSFCEPSWGRVDQVESHWTVLARADFPHRDEAIEWLDGTILRERKYLKIVGEPEGYHTGRIYVD